MTVHSVRCVFLSVLFLGGCAGDGPPGRALDAAGLRKSEQADMLKPPRAIPLRLQADAGLNADSRGRPLAVVARVYTLRQKAAFEAAPFAVFLTPGADREALGPDLVEVKDVTLVPGQRYEVLENVPREAAYIGIVALFHSPAPHRWRMAFGAAEAQASGVNVAVQACALAAGTPANQNAVVKASGPARCQ